MSVRRYDFRASVRLLIAVMLSVGLIVACDISSPSHAQTNTAAWPQLAPSSTDNSATTSVMTVPRLPADPPPPAPRPTFWQRLFKKSDPAARGEIAKPPPDEAIVQVGPADKPASPLALVRFASILQPPPSPDHPHDLPPRIPPGFYHVVPKHHPTQGDVLVILQRGLLKGVLPLQEKTPPPSAQQTRPPQALTAHQGFTPTTDQPYRPIDTRPKAWHDTPEYDGPYNESMTEDEVRQREAGRIVQKKAPPAIQGGMAASETQGPVVPIASLQNNGKKGKKAKSVAPSAQPPSASMAGLPPPPPPEVRARVEATSNPEFVRVVLDNGFQRLESVPIRQVSDPRYIIPY